MYTQQEYKKEYYLKNKEKIKEYNKKYKEENKDRRRKWNVDYQENNPEKRMLLSAKHRAKKLNILFDISEEDIIIPELCPYLNIPLSNIRGEGRKKTNLSLDRIDSSKGYVKGNVQVISDLANRMKQNASVEELLMFAKGIQKIHG